MLLKLGKLRISLYTDYSNFELLKQKTLAFIDLANTLFSLEHEPPGRSLWLLDGLKNKPIHYKK